MEKVPAGRRAASPRKGLYCAAKSPIDETWYRATVVETLSTGEMTMMKVIATVLLDCFMYIYFCEPQIL